MRTYDSVSDLYQSPKITVSEILSEGVLCISGLHDPFHEDDDWNELLKD